jgi:hypothetical protein
VSRVALGVRIKTGWAAVVLLEGPARAPRRIDSRVIELCDPLDPDARQPYHAGFGKARRDLALVARLVKRVASHARGSLGAQLREYAKQGHRPRRAAIVVPSLTDPGSIASPHLRAHAQEGQLYRKVVEASLRRRGITTTVVLEREAYGLLANALRRNPPAVKAAVAALGAAAARWRSEEKLAAAAACLLLGKA